MAPVELDALGPDGAYRARNRLTVTDVAGDPAVRLSLVPKLFIDRALAAARRAETTPTDERVAALGRAGKLFASGTVEGLSADDYELLVSRVAGMPISTVRAATRATADRAAEAYRSAAEARPVGAVTDWRDPLTRTGRAVWVRRADVFAVHAPGNHPRVHGHWLEALALGYRVVVRPSRREPLTPHRLVAALRAAGFGDDEVMLLPTDHAAADDVLRGADLGMVYGDDEVIGKHAGHTTVLPQGPGRSKILITADVDWRAHLDTLVSSVAHHAGTACVNTTAVFVEGDPAPVAAAVAERLAALPSLPPEDEKASLPVRPLETARTLSALLARRAEGTRPWLGGDGIADELSDGSAVLRPAVHQLPDPHAPQAGVELPFPCVWVAPWTPDAGLGPLRNTLVLTAMTRDDRLLDRLLAEPTIGNVYSGQTPTWWLAPGVPHDRYLAEFLMRTKAVVRRRSD
ncbi:aldehyde dehydrogenase family protein [Actinosynnema sp. CS-041913]|uniref:aldehyde dehydrogenase family protein n=1 Tax=Actinosynnema sp. CS-041913 TaxID=3239917 RepID=UPI003D8F34A2